MIIGLERIFRIGMSLACCTATVACSVTENMTATASPMPAINYFTADSTSIMSGETINLNWDVINADSIRIEPGIGEVQSTGTYRVTPTANVEYKLTASGPGGQVSAGAAIQVNPATASPRCMAVSCDPVTGRNADISLRWEQLSLCTEYQVQISNDERFSMLIYDRQQYTPYSATSPGLVYLAGGILECGHTYYVRVRCTSAATGQHVRSPWSVLDCLTVNSGLPVGGK
jgi:hypothetical protein